jgi:hypothetical protein
MRTALAALSDLLVPCSTAWAPLAGLIVVNIVTADPDAGRSQNDTRVRTIRNFTAPSPSQLDGTRANRDLLTKEVVRKAGLVDQRHGESDDVIEAFVSQALRAAHLRGSLPADPARFDDDLTAKDQATATSSSADSCRCGRRTDVGFARPR